MKERIVRFLNALDAALVPVAAGERLDLYHIGRSALVWKHGFQSATEDIDVVRPRHDQRLVEEALELFGRGTRKAVEFGLYLEVVPEGLPPVTGGSFKRATEVVERWESIRLFHLEDHDFAVTKLKRFSTKDRDDIRAMCDLGLLDPDTLARRVIDAYPLRLRDDKDDDAGRVAADENVQVVLNYLLNGEWRLT